MFRFRILPKTNCAVGVIVIILLFFKMTIVTILNGVLYKPPIRSDYHDAHHTYIEKDVKNETGAANEDSKLYISEQVFEVNQKLKYILFWKPRTYDPLYYLKQKGEQGFLEHKCEVSNCYVTDNRKLFGNALTKFDAIVFNGQVFKEESEWLDLPHIRSEHQKYILFETQSAGDYPFCSNKFDNYFNWTMSYRLDSDIPCPNIVVKNKTGHVIGPKKKMYWRNEHVDIESYDYYEYRNVSKIKPLFKTKRKAVAWFPADCTKRNQGKLFAYNLRQELMTYKLDVDIYGECGPLVCVRGNKECDYIKRDYFFILAVETSQAVDYVTDKLLTAIQNDVVPIVYGGANYSRFIPPESYLDATKTPADEIASVVVASMENTVFYNQFFEWQNLFSFHKADPANNICSLCAAINDEASMKTHKVYSNLRKWWNPEFRDECKSNSKKVQ